MNRVFAGVLNLGGWAEIGPRGVAGSWFCNEKAGVLGTWLWRCGGPWLMHALVMLYDMVGSVHHWFS